MGCFLALLTLAFRGPPVPAVQRIAESHLQSISNLSENQASEEEDELGELRELGYPREEDEEEEEEDDDDEEEEEDSQAEVLKGSRGSGKLKGRRSLGDTSMGLAGSSLRVLGHPSQVVLHTCKLPSHGKGLPILPPTGALPDDTRAAPIPVRVSLVIPLLPKNSGKAT